MARRADPARLGNPDSICSSDLEAFEDGQANRLLLFAYAVQQLVARVPVRRQIEDLCQRPDAHRVDVAVAAPARPPAWSTPDLQARRDVGRDIGDAGDTHNRLPGAFIVV